MAAKTIVTGVLRGLAGRCPNCGTGRLFAGYLRLLVPCPDCASDNSVYPSDDFPPYLTILVAGHVVVPSFVLVDHAYSPSLWLEAAIWLPFTALLCLVLLPRMKGATVGLCWATGLVRQEPAG